MRLKSIVLVFCVCLIWNVLKAVALENLPSRVVRVSLVQGEVTYQRPDLDKWVELNVNTPVLEGDKVWVGRDGRAEIEFEDGSYVRMAENTILEFSRLGPYEGPRNVEIRMNRGLATFGVRTVEGSFRIETPLFVTQVPEASAFRLEVDSDGSGRLVVFDGRTEVESPTGNLYLKNGETVRFLSSDPERYYLSANYEQDEWDRWNSERNEYLARLAQQRRQIPYDSGWSAGELNDYGTWYSVPTYGSVWRPHYGLDWIPFRHGRWDWYGQLGWTWISYEPWGWLPYHYGRWALVNGYGWSWVPGRRWDRWCPGAVGWIQGPNWIGWAPLAPYEPWYPYSYAAANIFLSKNFGYRHCISYLPHDSFYYGIASHNFAYPKEPMTSGRILPGQPQPPKTLAGRLSVANSYSGRRFTNDDLEIRRNLRSANPQVPSSGATSTGNSQQRVTDLLDRRSQIGTRSGTGSGNSSSSGSAIRVINGGNGVRTASSSEAGGRNDDNWNSERELVREQQRRQAGAGDGSRSGFSPSQRPQSQPLNSRVQPRSGLSSRQITVPNSGSGYRTPETRPPSTRYQWYRGPEGSGTPERSSGPNSSPSRFGTGVPYTPPVRTPSTAPSAPQAPRNYPSYNPPPAVRPAPSVQFSSPSPPPSRSSAGGGYGAGPSGNESRSTVRGRAGR